MKQLVRTYYRDAQKAVYRPTPLSQERVDCGQTEPELDLDLDLEEQDHRGHRKGNLVQANLPLLANYGGH